MINDIKSLFTRLNIARDIALKAAKAKSQFLANMSHEIRTPLNAIIGMTEILNDAELNEEQENHVSILKNSGETLLYLVNDILDSSKLDVGEVKLESVPFKIVERVEGVLDIFAPIAYAKGIELCSYLPDEIDKTVLGDPTRFTQILSNIVSNAIKFTTKGSVSIEVTKGDNNKFIIKIIDTGIGIPIDAQANIFDKFTQADTSTTRKYGGTGLGLSICKDLTRLMKGSVNLSSEEGEGTCFTIELDFEESDVAIEETSFWYVPVELKGKTALVVDPLEKNRENLVKYANSLNLKVLTAETYAQAIAIVKKSFSSIDLVMVDYHFKRCKWLGIMCKV